GAGSALAPTPRSTACPTTSSSCSTARDPSTCSCAGVRRAFRWPTCIESGYNESVIDASTRGHMSVVALSELLGASVRDATGAVRGRVREIAIAPQDHPTRIAFLIVKTPAGERVLSPDAISSAGVTVRASSDA